MNTLVIKPGYKGKLVAFLQESLGLLGDGIYGPKTKAAVLHYQRTNNLVADGIVGPRTWAKMGVNPQEFYADTDTLTSASWIKQNHLPEGEYVHQFTTKKWIFLHHTAGRSNPFKTIDQWAKDQRGRIGTHYVIGGLAATLDVESDLTKKQTEHNGTVVQAIDDKYWAYHLGPVKSLAMHRQSISIELCSAGILTKADDGTYRTWFNTKVHPSQVAVLDQPYRDSLYYHKYSDKQIESLKALLLLLRDKHDINLKSGLIAQLHENSKNPYRAFEYKEELSKGRIRGVLTHGQVRRDKSDVFPQKELIEMLLSL